MATDTLAQDTASLLAGFGIAAETLTAGDLPVASPIDGSRIASLRPHRQHDLDRMIADAGRAFLLWRAVPPPRRGELVRLFAEQLRTHKTGARPAGVDRGRQNPRRGPG
jgi:aldehyde dehydrogenase (NAD+)